MDGKNTDIEPMVFPCENGLIKWMQQRGITADNKVGKLIVKIERMASQERKELLGAAVTETELRAITPWLPSAGDSFNTMLNKLDVMKTEMGQEFVNWIELFEGSYDVSPLYKAFKIDPFTKQLIRDTPQQNIEQTPVPEDLKLPWGQ